MLPLLDALCRTRSWWSPADHGPSPKEQGMAQRIQQELARHDWLRLSLEEVSPGRPNLLALDGPEDEIELLLIGHLDTVPPTPGWTVPEHSVVDGRYYALGAADTKGGIAAMLDAIETAGPTRGVGCLLYADEEYRFLGMQHFLGAHPRLRPQQVLSVCGPPARLLTGCRGIIELELVLRGRPGHASRPWSGRSAIEALQQLSQELSAWAGMQSGPHKTVVNLAAVHGGSLDAEGAFFTGIPPISETANRIPDVAWALFELRPGGPEVTGDEVRRAVEQGLSRFNAGQRHAVDLVRFSVHFELPGYQSDADAVRPFVDAFRPLHQGTISDPSRSGYVDIAMLATSPDIGAVCIGPLGENAHGTDEWVDLESLGLYRDCLVRLLQGYRAPTSTGRR